MKQNSLFCFTGKPAGNHTIALVCRPAGHKSSHEVTEKYVPTGASGYITQNIGCPRIIISQVRIYAFLFCKNRFFVLFHQTITKNNYQSCYVLI